MSPDGDGAKRRRLASSWITTRAKGKTMARYYAVEAKDHAGKTRFWGDSYPTVKAACDAAKVVKRDNPFNRVAVLKEQARPSGHEFGARWTEFREILR
jgi:hypothetical protein